MRYITRKQSMVEESVDDVIMDIAKGYVKETSFNWSCNTPQQQQQFQPVEQSPEAEEFAYVRTLAGDISILADTIVANFQKAYNGGNVNMNQHSVAIRLCEIENQLSEINEELNTIINLAQNDAIRQAAQNNTVIVGGQIPMA